MIKNVDDFKLFEDINEDGFGLNGVCLSMERMVFRSILDFHFQFNPTNRNH